MTARPEARLTLPRQTAVSASVAGFAATLAAPAKAAEALPAKAAEALPAKAAEAYGAAGTGASKGSRPGRRSAWQCMADEVGAPAAGRAGAAGAVLWCTGRPPRR